MGKTHFHTPAEFEVQTNEYIKYPTLTFFYSMALYLGNKFSAVELICLFHQSILKINN